MFLPLSASIYLNFPFFIMLFMEIFATINKPYTIIETQMRVLGMFFSLSENVCNQATNKPQFPLCPLFHNSGSVGI